MDLPALLPEELMNYSKAADDNALFMELRESISHITDFVLYACEDETWTEKHHTFMSKALELVTRRMFRQRLHPQDAKNIAASIQRHWVTLQNIIQKDLKIEFEKKVYEVNTLLFCSQSGYLKHLVITHCSDKDIKFLKLVNPPFDWEFFRYYLIFSEQGDLPNLWHHTSTELIKFMKMAVDIQCEALEKLAVETYKRYLDLTNVFKIASEAFQSQWKYLYKECALYVNDSWCDINFHTELHGFAVELKSFDDVTLEQFKAIQDTVTYLRCRFTLAENKLLPELIKGCTSLHALDLSEASHGKEILKALNPQIDSLTLKASEWLDSESLENIVNLAPHLTELDLSSNTHLNYRNWGVLAKIKNLQKLNITSCHQIVENDLKIILQSSPNLIEFKIAECKRLSEASFLMLGRFLRYIQTLDVSNTSISDRALSEIATRCSSLHTILLKGCISVTDKGLKELVSRLPNLTYLNVEGCSITQNIKEILSNIHPRLRFLSL